MRRTMLGVSALAAAIALSACGGAGSAATTFKQFVASFGAQPYVQVKLTASFTGANSTKVETILKQLSYEVRVENPSGGSISSAKGLVNTEELVNVGSTTVLDVRQVSQNLYVKFDLTPLSTLKGSTLPAGELTVLQAVLGGKWWELPKSLIESLVPAAARSQAARGSAKVKQVEGAVVAALEKFLITSPYKTTASGFTESGTALAFDRAMLPTIEGLVHHAVHLPTGSSAKGSYQLSLSTSGTTVTAFSVALTAPSGSTGANATATVAATVAHDSVAIVAPSGATVVSKQLLEELSSGAIS